MSYPIPGGATFLRARNNLSDVANGAYALSNLGTEATWLPPKWNTQWAAAKAAAIAGTGTAKIAVIGDSYVAGQSSGTVTDCLLYGFVGRLDAILAAQLGGWAEGYTIAGCNPGGGLNSPSSPYGNSAISGKGTVYDGGIGQAWGTTLTGSTGFTITAPVHPVTSAPPVAMDLLTIDFNSNTWSWAVDGGSATTVTTSGPGGTNYAGSLLRRTSITFSGSTTHTVTLVQNAANGLIFIGHVTYYGGAASGSGGAGLGIMRGGIGGFRSVDFATGAGATAGSAGNASAMPDHIIAWSGNTGYSVNTTYMGTGFPWQPDLAIFHVGGDDCTYGGSPEALRKAITRFINAFRRGIPGSSTSPGASILIVGAPYASEYSDNPNTGGTPYEWQRYKTILQELAQSYGCGWIDLQEVFGETPVGRGLMAVTDAHPTQNGAGTNGGDGHLLIAQTIAGVL